MYTLSAEAAKTGVGAVRPLWLEYPGDPGALTDQAKYEFLSGPDFLVAPVYQDSDTRDGIHLPKGTWTDYWTGRTYQGPTTINGYHAPLDTLPLFVREGAIVPMWPKGTTSWQTRDRHELDWDLYPAAHGTSHYTLYEDDGVTRDFTKGAAATQQVSLHADGGGTTLSVGASRGEYAGKVDARSYRFTVHGSTAPARVLLGGRQLPSSAWSFDPGAHVTTITVPSLPLDRGFTVRLVDGR
ncbi:glycoside hydrolase family 31 protein, partial [Streptomyces broussonetiae]